MNIYKVSQTQNKGYDTYDSFICYANTPEEASKMLPNDYMDWDDNYSSWCSYPDNATITLIGSNDTVTEPSVILSSFNAG